MWREMAFPYELHLLMESYQKMQAFQSSVTCLEQASLYHPLEIKKNPGDRNTKTDQGSTQIEGKWINIPDGNLSYWRKYFFNSKW